MDHRATLLVRTSWYQGECSGHHVRGTTFNDRNWCDLCRNSLRRKCLQRGMKYNFSRSLIMHLWHNYQIWYHKWPKLTTAGQNCRFPLLPSLIDQYYIHIGTQRNLAAFTVPSWNRNNSILNHVIQKTSQPWVRLGLPFPPHRILDYTFHPQKLYLINVVIKLYKVKESNVPSCTICR